MKVLEIYRRELIKDFIFCEYGYMTSRGNFRYGYSIMPVYVRYNDDNLRKYSCNVNVFCSLFSNLEHE